jgi:hypothetical protein
MSGAKPLQKRLSGTSALSLGNRGLKGHFSLALGEGLARDGHAIPKMRNPP